MAPDPLRPLLDAAVEGDDVALAELVRRTQPDVARLCAALGSPGRVDDLVQDTYLRVLRSLGTFRGDGPVRSWLLTIARRTCADDVRQRQRDRRLGGRLHLLSGDAPPAATGVDQLLDAIDDDRREAFLLTQVVGLSYEEAAAVVGCPIGTIRSQVARARADLLALVRAAEAR